MRENKLAGDEVPDLLIISDMQFNQEIHFSSPAWNLVQDNITKMFSDSDLGFELHGHPLYPPQENQGKCQQTLSDTRRLQKVQICLFGDHKILYDSVFALSPDDVRVALNAMLAETFLCIEPAHSKPCDRAVESVFMRDFHLLHLICSSGIFLKRDN